jgi:Xaa-Pro aminopeptidase
MDFGIFLNGYASDFTRTVVLGKATGDFRRAYAAVCGALERVEASKLGGRKASWVDGICRTYLETAGLGRYFSHATGHGLGLEIHEAPAISSRSAAVIRAGELFTLEPGVYIPARFGIRIEDVVLAGRDGCRRLTRASHSLIEL